MANSSSENAHLEDKAPSRSHWKYPCEASSSTLRSRRPMLLEDKALSRSHWKYPCEASLIRTEVTETPHPHWGHGDPCSWRTKRLQGHTESIHAKPPHPHWGHGDPCTWRTKRLQGHTESIHAKPPHPHWGHGDPCSWRTKRFQGHTESIHAKPPHPHWGHGDPCSWPSFTRGAAAKSQRRSQCSRDAV